jgi:Glycosyltransferase family 87
MISDQTLLRIVRSQSAVALIGDLVRATLAVVIVGIIGLCIAYYVALSRVMFDDLHMNDFGKFYYSARAFLDGTDMYAPSPATAVPFGEHEVGEFANMNPPHFHVLLLPLARLEPFTALVIWWVTSVAALAISVGLVARALEVRWTAPAVVWAIAGIVACSATETVVITGQITFLLLLPFTLSWVDARRGRWSTSALYLGVLTSIKPFFAIFGLYLLLARHVRAAAAMAVATIACFLLGVAIFGWSAYSSWLGALSGVHWTWAVMNGSLVAPMARTLGTNPFFEPIILRPDLIAPLGALGGLLVVAVACVSVTRDQGPNSTDRAFALFMLLALVASPLGWIYYLWLPLGPLAALWMSGALRRWPLPAVFLLLALPGLLCPLRLTLVAQDRAWGGLLPGSIYSVTLLCLWAAVLSARIRRNATSAL